LLTKFLRVEIPRDHYKKGQFHDITSQPQAAPFLALIFLKAMKNSGYLRLGAFSIF